MTSTPSQRLSAYDERVSQSRLGRFSGAVARVTGHELELRGLKLRVGDRVLVHASDGDRPAKVVALTPSGAMALVLGETIGIDKGDAVTLAAHADAVVVSESLVGRVIDAHGNPIDSGPPIAGERVTLEGSIPNPLQRQRIDTPLPVGVRVIDTMCTAARGQRLGIFGGSGVGKSTLLGMMARGTTADVNVLALVGERGREVREMIEDDLGPDGLQRTIVVVATSDQPPLVRLRAALLAARIAEWLADRGRDVLLLCDSLTRIAMAQREVGLAAGEPPTARGYTPSVFALLPELLERAGPRANGTVTAFYTVLVEGDDLNDPIADAARAILDGHIVLDRELAVEGRWLPVDPLASLSRLAQKVLTEDRLAGAAALRALLAAADDVRDLVEVGAYVSGTNPAADAGLAVKPAIVDFFRQLPHEQTPFDEAWAELGELPGRVVAPVGAP